MKKTAKVATSIIASTLIFGGFYSVYGNNSELKVFKNDSVFYADGDIIIDSPSKKKIKVETLNNEKAKKLVNEANGMKIKGTVELNIEEEVVVFAQGEVDLYNIPLVNSPNLFKGKDKNNYFTVKDRLYKTDKKGIKATLLGSNEYKGMNKEQLSEKGRVYWISNPQLSHDGDALFFVSNRRSIYESNIDYINDLWMIDFETGTENLVALGGRNYLGEINDNTIVSVFNDNIYEIIIAETGEKITETENVLGADTNNIYYILGDFVVKHEIYTSNIEEIIDLNHYAYSGVTLSPESNISFINITDRTTGLEKMVISTSTSTIYVDLPLGLIINTTNWLDNETLLISGSIKENELTYKFEIGKGE